MIAFSGADGLLQITLTNKELVEFKQLLNRGSNTWDTKPSWVMELQDKLNNNPKPYHLQIVKP